MSDASIPVGTPAKRKPWLLVLTQAQFSNPQAEEMGERNWLVFAFVLMLSCLCLALPFMGRVISSSMVQGDPTTYPGLAEAIVALQASGRDFTIQGGILIPGPGTPAEEMAGSWKVIWTGAGGELPESLKNTEPAPRLGASTGDPSKPGILVFRNEGLNILHSDGSPAMVGGTWTPLEGFRFSLMPTDPSGVAAFLGTVAMSNVMNAAVSNLFMMSVQTIVYVIVMGLFLSLSGLKIGMTGTVPASRKRGFSRSVRSAAAVTLGPAFLSCVLMLFIPLMMAYGFILFALSGGARIIWLYMSRFPGKKKK